jgi:hypothetical protein
MNESFFRKPVPALALAVGVGIAASKANANAARAIGIPVLMFGMLLSLVFAVIGLGS